MSAQKKKEFKSKHANRTVYKETYKGKNISAVSIPTVQ